MLKDLFNDQTKKIVEEYTVKPEKMSSMCEGINTPYFPTLSLNSKTIPEIKEWEVDGEYVVVLKIKQKSKSMYTEGKDEVYDARFDIKSVAVVENDEPDEPDDKEEPKVSDSKIGKMYGV